MKNKEEKEEEVALWILAQRTCINPKPSSHIYGDLDLQKTHQGSILAAQTELVAIHFCP